MCKDVRKTTVKISHFKKCFQIASQERLQTISISSAETTAIFGYLRHQKKKKLLQSLACDWHMFLMRCKTEIKRRKTLLRWGKHWVSRQMEPFSRIESIECAQHFRLWYFFLLRITSNATIHYSVIIIVFIKAYKMELAVKNLLVTVILAHHSCHTF